MSFTFHQSASLQEAVQLGARFAEHGRFIAGGTDLVIQINRKRVAPRHLVSLSGVPGLSGIDVSDAGIWVGALTTLKSIERFPLFCNEIGMLGEAARVVGGHQVRNIGTIGGNVVNASPAADTVAPLLALDATLDLVGESGQRTIELARFLKGPGKTDRRPDEVLTGIRFAPLPERTGTAFVKAGRRRAMEISVVCVAVRLSCTASGDISHAAIALGAAAPTTLRCTAAERMLIGHRPADELLRDASAAAAAESSPISDVRASTTYRLELIDALVERALHQCVAAMARPAP